ncbi:glycosyltransferase family 1 protein [bacterium]|nr:MAG: glycosyltransferase family 1 protein [bacterium]
MRQRMKITFLSDDFPPRSFGGAGISTYELARGVKDAGHDVSVITTCRKQSDAGESDYDGLHEYRIASDYSGRWRGWVSVWNPPIVRRVEALLKEIGPDVVHVNNVHYYLSYRVIVVAKRNAKAVVVTLRDAMSFSFGKLVTEKYLRRFDARLTARDLLAQAGKRYNPLRNFFIRRYLRAADARFAVSEALQRALTENGIENVQVIHTGIDVDAWRTTGEAVAAFKERHGLSGKKVVLFGGRLNAGREAIAAMRLVAQRVSDAVLLVMGKDEDARALKQAGQDISVVSTGWISGEEKVSAYAASDVVLVPSSYFDAFPRSVIEAMASGKPVVGTCYGGAPEAIVDGVTGYVVNPFDTASLAGKITELLLDGEKASRFGVAGRERIHTAFSLERYVGAYLAHYKQLVK